MWINADGRLMAFHSFVNANSIINMKSTIIATLGLLALALPASAGYVLEANTYAREYCTLRNLGWGRDAAVEHAVKESLAPGIPVEVYHEGAKTDADVLVAFRAAKYRCPEHN